MGTGKPLVLIHGFGASIGHWRKNIPVLAAAGYRVFAIDLLGFGGSDKPALSYTLELWQQQLKDFWDAHITEPTVFIGNSIGALLSLMVVTEYPEIAAGGVLINCAGGLNHRPDELNLPLRLVMGGFTKLVSSKITGPFCLTSFARNPASAAPSPRSTATQKRLRRNWLTYSTPLPATPVPNRFLPQFSPPLQVLPQRNSYLR
jgi:pimeloyl-ACP methyl ester carboxylesterase